MARRLLQEAAAKRSNRMMRRLLVGIQGVVAFAIGSLASTCVSTLAEGRHFDVTAVTPSLAVSAQEQPASSAARPPSRGAVLDAMNRYRARQRLRPLELDRRLNSAAEDRIRDMFDRGYFDHLAPDGGSPFAAMDRRGYRYSSAAENLAVAPCSARVVVEGWMRSRGHRGNILGDFQDSGIAIVPGSPTHRTRGCTVVALFARREGQRPR
jgi:uncharacterized protein YkwD